MATIHFTEYKQITTNKGLVKSWGCGDLNTTQDTSSISRYQVYGSAQVATVDALRARITGNLCVFDDIACFTGMAIGEEKTLFQYKDGRYITCKYTDATHFSYIGYDKDDNIITRTDISNNLASEISELEYWYRGWTIGYSTGEVRPISVELYRFRDNSGANANITLNKTGAISAWVTDFIQLNPVGDDPYSTNDNHTPDGGYGGFDYTGDDVDIPALPTISAAASGFVRLYNPTIGEVQSLANYLWSGAFDLATYKKLFGNPMDCFLSFGIIPVTPPRSVNKEAISFANMPDPGVTAYKITDQFKEFDCGSVTINGSKYTSSAMDYSPYTKAELFLPFCGTHSLAVDDIMDSTISIKYHMDLYTGACVAYVKITRTNSDGSTLDSVLYQFTGNILATIPLTGADHSNFIQSMLFMGAAVAATVATAGGAAPEIGGAMAVGDSVSTSALGGAAISASGINAVMSMKPNVIRSGNLSANAGFLGLKKPVITLTCPNLCRPADENKLAGMPCQKSGTLSDFKGFNIVSACHLDNIPCTMEELRMIDTALAKGVII